MVTGLGAIKRVTCVATDQTVRPIPIICSDSGGESSGISRAAGRLRARRKLDVAVHLLIVNHMVNYMTLRLDRTFAALADPTRRAVLARLEEEGDLSVGDLARPLPISLPAVLKHLHVLSDAGLISRSKSGRTVTCRLEAAPMREAMAWLGRYERFWAGRLDSLEAFLDSEEEETS